MAFFWGLITYMCADGAAVPKSAGNGRTSTYASIVGVLRERGYAVLYRRRFVPTERGRVVTAFLETWFARWVADGFTGRMEADLDRVAGGTTREAPGKAADRARTAGRGPQRNAKRDSTKDREGAETPSKIPSKTPANTPELPVRGRSRGGMDLGL